MEKKCSYCNNIFIPSKFHPNTMFCSHSCRCKNWQKNNIEKYRLLKIKTSETYRKKHPEKIIEQIKRAKESGRNLEAVKKYYKNHPEKMKQKEHERYWNNREYSINKMKRYRNTEQGKISHRASERKLRYKRKDKSNTFFLLTKSKQYIIRARDNDTCVYCHKKINHILEKLTYDHIIAQENNGCNSINNIVIACEKCNCSKRHILLDVWLNSNYCKLNNITKENINPIVWQLLDEQNKEKKICLSSCVSHVEASDYH